MEKKGIDRNAIFLWIIAGCFFIILGLAKNNVVLQYDRDAFTNSLKQTVDRSSQRISSCLRQNSFNSELLQKSVYELDMATELLFHHAPSDNVILQQYYIANELKSLYHNGHFPLLPESDRTRISDFLSHDFYTTTDVPSFEEFTAYLRHIAISSPEISEEVCSAVAVVYGIPSEILSTLDTEYVNSLYSAIQSNPDSIESYDIYHTGEGGVGGSTAPRGFASGTEEVQGPVKIRLTIMEIDADTLQISAAFDWRQMADERMHDIITVGCSKGVVWANSTDGFYTHTDDAGHTETLNFVKEKPNSSKDGIFSEHHRGAVGEFDLELIDAAPQKDYAFIRTNITREGAGETIFAAYAHQTEAVSVDFNINFYDGDFSAAPGPAFDAVYQIYRSHREYPSI